MKPAAIIASRRSVRFDKYTDRCRSSGGCGAWPPGAMVGTQYRHAGGWMRRRDLVKALLAFTAAPTLLALGVSTSAAQETPPPPGPALPPAPSDGSMLVPAPSDQGPPRNNIFGLNVGRLKQRLYIWAAADMANASGGDWGYLTSVWTIEDREDRRAELNLQVFLDYCFEYEIHPIVRVATRFDSNPKKLSWMRPDWDEPAKWRAYFENARWPTQRVWIVAGNEPNLGREWGGEVDATSYAQYLAHFLDVFESSPLFKVVGAPVDITNTTELPVMQDAFEFFDGMEAAVPGIFERLPAWASNPYKSPSRGTSARFTHLAYEAELDHIGREMPVLITEAGHLETGDDDEIARFYAEAYPAWKADPKVIAATPLFWHPDRNDYWMFEMDSKGAFLHRSPTYELLRQIPKVAGSPNYLPELVNVARTTPFEEPVTAEAPAPDVPASSGGQPGSHGHPGDTWATEGRTSSQEARVPASSTALPARPTAGLNPRTPSGTVSLRVANTDGQGARLRTEPSREADSITVLPDGALVQALGPVLAGGEQDWRRVRTEDGAEGWIASDLLAPSAPGDQ
jgi:hypothetical protein